ncbi:MAG: M23 family metallopeptidase [Candidatus Puniceispirillaceae bacterium]
MKQALSSCLLFLCLLSLLSNPSKAETPEIAGAIWQDGHVTQGGLVTFLMPRNATATLDGEMLATSQQGYGAFGFHRDDEKAVTIIITMPDNSQHITSLTPTKRSYQTQSITGLAGKYVSPPEKVLKRISNDREAVMKARAITSLQDDFVTSSFDWPVTGTITGIYGSQRILNGKPRAPHYGIDIAASTGTPVIAPANGTVTLVEDLYYTGWTIIIDHGLGISSTMLHLKSASVNIGDDISQGDVIGFVGSTGRSTGPHLDWRLNWLQKRLDPQLAAITRQP